MGSGPDPHGDFVIEEEVTSVIAEDATNYPTDEPGVYYPIDEYEANRAHGSRPGAVSSGLADDDVTADTFESAPPLRVRFGAQERGK